MATLTTMRANVRTDLVVDPNGDMWSNSTIDRFINRFVGNVYSWMNVDFQETSATLTLTTGVATYDLSTLANYDKLQSIRLTGNFDYLDPANIDDLENTVDLTVQGEPSKYYFYADDTIGLYPVPDGVITTADVRYERSEVTLTDSDSPAWETKWHYVCELYALWQCFDTMPGFEQKALKAEKMFKLEEALMKESLWQRDNLGYGWKFTDTTVWPS